METLTAFIEVCGGNFNTTKISFDTTMTDLISHHKAVNYFVFKTRLNHSFPIVE